MPAIRRVTSPAEIAVIRTLFQEYAAALDVDLSFQGFDAELRDLPGNYAGPRGALLLAEDATSVLGCVAVRPLDLTIAEMKRLYVRPAARKSGLGRLLAESAIAFAREAGYHRLRLDTLPSMARAQGLYASLGFQPIAPYRANPIPGTAYLELPLT